MPKHKEKIKKDYEKKDKLFWKEGKAGEEQKKPFFQRLRDMVSEGKKKKKQKKKY
jgi:hypothetical protein